MVPIESGMFDRALRSQSRPLTRVSGARKAPIPGFIDFCDPTERKRPPDDRGWVYEIKADGYRAQLHQRPGETKVYSRTGLDWTEEFGSIAAAAKSLRAKSAVIDGEVIVYGSNGLPDFQQLRRELGRRSSAKLHFHAFDVLYLDGYDLKGVAFTQRKQILKLLLAETSDTFVFVDYVEADGAEIFRNACDMGLEGLVAKRADAPYRSGRQKSWIKLKCKKSETFPIVAFVEKLGARTRRVASLYVGRREGDQLLYAGKVRTGYTEKSARELRERLDPLIRRTSPLSAAVKKPKATWVDPEVNVEVEYGALTDDRLLRAAVFKGFRDDLATPKARAPRLAPSSVAHPRIGVPRENILQLLPDAVAPSKNDLASYWCRAWKKALPYLGHRPLKLVRHVHGTTFYHKGPLPKDIPGAVHKLRIQKREGGEGTRLWIDDLEGFLGLVEIGAIELHPWNAMVDDIEVADRIVIDLDPGEGTPWDAVVESSLRMRGIMREEGFDPWPKLTGGKGVHLMAPFQERVSHDQAHKIARRLVAELAARFPDEYILSATASRTGRIFLDYLRNGRGTTAIGAYSPRARDRFPIAAPITWKRLEAGIRPNAFTIRHPFRIDPTAGRLKQEAGP
jgi:bifunctional non-homologous end joining protein LigD